MDSIEKLRDQIRKHYEGSTAYEDYFKAHEAEYAAYYNSMYLIQDSTESLAAHRERGFSQGPQDNPEQGFPQGVLIAYIEFWGVMQALIIQQDSIAELYKVLTGKELDMDSRLPWMRIRELRNECAGHPAKKNRPKKFPFTRTFMGRGFGDYKELTYEKWEQGKGTTHPQVSLDDLLEAYVSDAAKVLKEALYTMQKRWPTDPTLTTLIVEQPSKRRVFYL